MQVIASGNEDDDWDPIRQRPRKRVLQDEEHGGKQRKERHRLEEGTGAKSFHVNEDDEEANEDDLREGSEIEYRGDDGESDQAENEDIIKSGTAGSREEETRTKSLKQELLPLVDEDDVAGVEIIEGSCACETRNEARAGEKQTNIWIRESWMVW